MLRCGRPCWPPTPFHSRSYPMARIKTSSLLAEIRGMLGGVVFTSNGNGFYCKQNKTPVQPRTTSQSDRRSRFSDCAHSYSSMTPLQIAAWVTYAADVTNTRYNYFGDAYLPNAFNQYISINLMRNSVGLSITSTAPTGALPNALPSMTLFIDFQPSPTNSYITNNAGFHASIAYVHLLGRLWPSLGRTIPPTPLFFVVLIPKASFPNYDLQADLISRFGSLPLDGNWYFSISPCSSEFRLGTAVTFAGRSGDTVVS